VDSKKKKSTKKEPITMLETNVICEHCFEVQTHEELGNNGSCKSCNGLIRKELF
jgi:uncharacterized CHY-type Zn-finger protein